MEENVALDSTKQKKFVKSIKGIKKLIQKDAASKPVDKGNNKVKSGKVTKKKRKERGLVYLSHIPHGFYEHEMTQYFKQFGVVTNARVIKSKRTGRSKGFAFVEFKEPAVAEIVADTMNNYLMGKRLIKAACVPPEKQRRAFRKNWSSVNNPGYNMRMKMKKQHNEDKDEEGDLKRAHKLLSNVSKTKKKLSELGISYDFFEPVDVPEAIVNNVQEKTEESKGNSTNEAKSKKKIKVATEPVIEKKPVIKVGKAVESESSKENITSTRLESNKRNKKENKPIVEEQKLTSTGKVKKFDGTVAAQKEIKEKKLLKNGKETKTQSVVDKKEHKLKKGSLKSKGATPLEDFIKVEQNDDSDSSGNFDSDEFERLLESDDDSSGDNSDEGSGDDLEDDDNSDEVASDISEEEHPKKKNNKVILQASPLAKKNAVKEVQKKGPHPLGKRITPQKTTPAAPLIKKPKFQKQTQQKQGSKQFKKKIKYLA